MVKNDFTERDVNAMLAELAVVRERLHKLFLFRELATYHKLEQIRRVTMPEKQAAWAREDGFDRIEVMAVRHRRTLGSLYAGDDQKPFQIGVHYHTRRSPTRQEFAVGMKAVVNRLRLELLLSQPQHELPPR